MPLTPGSSKAVVSNNISEMVNSGHPQKVAVAAALHNADKTAKDAGNPNHASNGQFASSGGGGTGKTDYTKKENFEAQHKKMYPNATQSDIDNAHKNYTASQSKSSGYPSLLTQSRQDESGLHDLYVKSPEGKWNKHSSGPHPDTLLSNFKKEHDAGKGAPQGYANVGHKGFSQFTERNGEFKKGAKDAEQPQLALDPNSGSLPSVPWKGRNLNDDPVGDRSHVNTDCSQSTGDAVWPGRVL